jgi:hypothetical protein
MCISDLKVAYSLKCSFQNLMHDAPRMNSVLWFSRLCSQPPPPPLSVCRPSTTPIVVKECEVLHKGRVTCHRHYSRHTQLRSKCRWHSVNKARLPLVWSSSRAYFTRRCFPQPNQDGSTRNILKNSLKALLIGTIKYVVMFISIHK